MYRGQLCCQAPSQCFPHMLPHFTLATAWQGPAGEDICRRQGLSDFPMVVQVVDDRVLSSWGRFLLPHRQSNALHGPQGHRVPTPSPGASPQEAAGAAVSSAGWRMTTEGQALLCWGKSLCCCPCLLGSPPSGSPGPVLSLLMGALGEERARDRWGCGRSRGLPQARAPAIICCVIWASRRQPHQEGFGSRKRKLLQLFAAERDLR